MEYTFADLKEEFALCEKEYEIARANYNDALEALQAACSHETIVGGNQEYKDLNIRVCVTCGLYDYRHANDDGDEYNYPTLADFKVLPVYTRVNGRLITHRKAYKPENEQEVYRWRKVKK